MPDFIVVGAGSAGAVVASRLSEDPSVSVVLLEAGTARVPRESRIPAAFSKLFKTQYDWAFHTEPEPELGGRRLFWPRGRLLGGSSAMNAMIWTRPAREDFDRWVERGAVGWSYEEVGPYFDRAERPQATGAASPVGIPVAALRTVNPISRAFVAACQARGLGPNDGFGAGHLDGTGLFRVTQRRGARVSAADGYLTPARTRANLSLRPATTVHRIRFTGRRATGVSYQEAGSPNLTEVEGRVILCAGAIGSPHLLLRSGVGAARALERAGVAVGHDLPGVGRNLQDHLAIGALYTCPRRVTLDRAEGWAALLDYLIRRRGPLTSNVAEAGAFLRNDPGAPAPDLELLAAPVFFVDHGFGQLPGRGYTVAAVLQHPASRGTIELRSPDPLAPPAIRPGYLSAPEDLATLAAGLEWARRIGGAPELAEFRGEEVLPAGAPPLEFIRSRAETLYHPVGTCQIGQGEEAVVSERLAVRGLEDLWVADASVMPAIPTGHTHAPTVMIGERAAALMAADAR